MSRAQEGERKDTFFGNSMDNINVQKCVKCQMSVLLLFVTPSFFTEDIVKSPVFSKDPAGVTRS